MEKSFKYRVGFLGCPSKPDVPWSEENIRKLKRLGFNTIQLNIAWGARPGDEPLNLEDVVDMSGIKGFRQKLPLRSKLEPEKIKTRRGNLRERIKLCRKLGMRTIFHFGAPYNMHCRFGDNPPNCLMDPDVQKFYSSLLRAFDRQFPGVDDILLYTYDQDAWLCSEFGTCPSCLGIPLHDRVSVFVNNLARNWRKIKPDGRLWWEPWEISAGQVLKAIPLLDKKSVALSLHSNIAEVQVAMPVDHWLENAVSMAKQEKIPVIVEHFLGAPTEEVEPFLHLSWPLVIRRGLGKIAALEVDGIKEYYGIVPEDYDANLHATSIFLSDPEISEDSLLQELSRRYGGSSKGMIKFWRLTSDAMDLFPWYTSWYIREIGKCRPDHSMSAAFLRGQQAHTPSWESTRRAIFMKTDNQQPDPWMLEDVQLQCELSAGKLDEAISLGKPLAGLIPEELHFDQVLSDFIEFRRRVLSYAYHIRETNLTMIIRQCLDGKRKVPGRVLGELKSVLKADMENQGNDEPCLPALKLLEADPAKFADRCFLVDEVGKGEKGGFSVTSR